jgi:hypothetical protein
LRRASYEIGDGEEAAAVLADIPLVGWGGEAFDESVQLLLGVGAEAGDEAVVAEGEGNDRDDVGEEEARPTKGSNARGKEHCEEGDGAGDEHGFGRGVGEFEDGDGFVLMEGVGEDVAGFEMVEVVEGGEDGAEAGEIGGDVGGVDGAGFVGEGGVEGGAFEGLMVGVFVGEADVDSGACGGLEARGERDQGASGAGAEVEYLMSAELIDDGAEAWGDGSVRVAEAPERLQGVGEEVAQERWEGGVVVNFDEGVVAHGCFGCPGSSASVTESVIFF